MSKRLRDYFDEDDDDDLDELVNGVVERSKKKTSQVEEEVDPLDAFMFVE